jgi:cadmium resistance protein CadD (predicted permease)
MPTILRTIGIAIVAFAAANVGDLFMLVLFFSKKTFRASHVIAGQYMGVSALSVVCLVASFGTYLIPHGWVHFLGIVPLVVGAKNLLDLRAGSEETPAQQQQQKRFMKILHPNTLMVASVSFADASDNLGVFVPVFARSTISGKIITMIVFLILIGVWCIVAITWFATHASARK